MRGLIYSSKLCTGRSEVANILRFARSNNCITGITGILVFDGEGFLQYFEGLATRVHTLFSRIELDPRHTEVELLQHGVITSRGFLGFSMGYAECESIKQIINDLEMVPGQNFEGIRSKIVDAAKGFDLSS